MLFLYRMLIKSSHQTSKYGQIEPCRIEVPFACQSFDPDEESSTVNSDNDDSSEAYLLQKKDRRRAYGHSSRSRNTVCCLVAVVGLIGLFVMLLNFKTHISEDMAVGHIEEGISTNIPTTASNCSAMNSSLPIVTQLTTTDSGIESTTSGVWYDYYECIDSNGTVCVVPIVRNTRNWRHNNALTDCRLVQRNETSTQSDTYTYRLTNTE